LFEESSHVFGEKGYSGVLTNASYLHGPFAWHNERDPGVASRRRRNDPAARAGNLRIDDHLETELVNEEPPASLLISNPDRGKMQPEKGLQELCVRTVTRIVLSIGLP
jgi:hypothetical protein